MTAINERNEQQAAERAAEAFSLHLPAEERGFLAKRLRYAVGVSAISAVVALALSATLLGLQESVGWFYPAAGELVTLSSIGVLLTLFVTPSISIIGYRMFTHESDRLSEVEKIMERGRNWWLGRLFISFVLTAALTLAVSLLFFGIEAMFTGARITTLAGVLLSTTYAAAISFGVAYYISGLDEYNFIRLLAVVLVLGLMISFLIAQDDQWWQNSISFLGHDPGSGIFFNLSIISVGVIALTLVRDLLDDLYVVMVAGRFPRRGFNILRVLLVLIGVGIIGVGLFPTTITPLSDDLHNLSSHGMALAFMVAMLTLGWLAPGVYPRFFLRVSLALGLASVAATVAYFVWSVINFVTLELLLFAFFGVWVFMFKQYTKDYINQQDHDEILRAWGAYLEGKGGTLEKIA